MVVPLVSKIVKPKGHSVANFEKVIAQVCIPINLSLLLSKNTQQL